VFGKKSYKFRGATSKVLPLLLWMQQGSQDPTAIFDCYVGWDSYFNGKGEEF